MNLLLKLTLTTLLTTFLSFGWSQTYDPVSGNWYYPNGTAYLSNKDNLSGDGPKVIRKDENGKTETVDCNSKQKRCKEILEEAEESLEEGPGTGPAEGGPAEGGEENEFLSSVRIEWKEYLSQYQLKPGVWHKSKGKWNYVSDPGFWTNQIIKNWR